MQTHHTPTPWEQSKTYIVQKGHGVSLANATVMKGLSINADAENYEKALANAAFIVRAVNSHDALLNASKEVVKAYREHEEDHLAFMIVNLRKAINDAGGK